MIITKEFYMFNLLLLFLIVATIIFIFCLLVKNLSNVFFSTNIKNIWVFIFVLMFFNLVFLFFYFWLDDSLPKNQFFFIFINSISTPTIFYCNILVWVIITLAIFGLILAEIKRRIKLMIKRFIAEQVKKLKEEVARIKKERKEKEEKEKKKLKQQDKNTQKQNDKKEER